MTTLESTTLNGNQHLEYFRLEPFSVEQVRVCFQIFSYYTGLVI